MQFYIANLNLPLPPDGRAWIAAPTQTAAKHAAAKALDDFAREHAEDAVANADIAKMQPDGWGVIQFHVRITRAEFKPTKEAVCDFMNAGAAPSSFVDPAKGGLETVAAYYHKVKVGPPGTDGPAARLPEDEGTDAAEPAETEPAGEEPEPGFDAATDLEPEPAPTLGKSKSKSKKADPAA